MNKQLEQTIAKIEALPDRDQLIWADPFIKIADVKALAAEVKRLREGLDKAMEFVKLAATTGYESVKFGTHQGCVDVLDSLIDGGQIAQSEVEKILNGGSND